MNQSGEIRGRSDILVYVKVLYPPFVLRRIQGGLRWFLQSYFLILGRSPQFDGKVIVDPNGGVLIRSISFALFSVDRTQHARMNICPCIVWYTSNYPLFHISGQHSCRTYCSGDLPLLRGTLCLSEIDCCALEGLILGQFPLPSPQYFLQLLQGSATISL